MANEKEASKNTLVQYANLHLHTEYSSLDGFSRIEDIFDEQGNLVVQGITSKLKELGHKYCAVTDHATLSATQPAYKAFKDAGVQLLPGCEFYVVDDMGNHKGYQNHIVVIAKNKTGWQNILKMNYIGYEQGAKEVWGRLVARIDLKTLAKYSSDLVISSACLAGIPSHMLAIDQEKEAEEHVKMMLGLFPESYFLEIQAVDYYGMLDSGAKTPLVDKEWIENQAETQKKVNDRVIDLGEKLKVPIVVTTDSHYVNKEDRDSHLLMLAVQSKTSIDTPALGSRLKGGRLAFEATPMLSSEDLIRIFTETNSGFNGYPKYMVEEWLKNTIKAAEMCEPADYLAFTGYKIPEFPVDEARYFEKFSRWKNSLSQEEVDGILTSSADYLKSRLDLK